MSGADAAESVPGSRTSIRLGEVIAAATGSVRRHCRTLIGLALVSVLPGVLLTFVDARRTDAGLPEYDLLYFAAALLSMAAGSLVHAAMLHVVLADLDGRSSDFAGALQTGLRFTPAMLGLTIVIILGATLGFVLLFIPGIIIVVIWSVASPAMVSERLGVFESLARSRALTRGSRWKLFALGIVISLVLLGGSLLLVPMARAVGVIEAAIVQALTSVAFVMIYTPLVAATFTEARRAREGISTDHLVEVFA